MILKILFTFTVLYLLFALRIYVLTLHYSEFDGTRKRALFAPIITIILFICFFREKEYSMIYCFLSRLPSTYKIIGLQYCLLGKTYEITPQDKKAKININYKIEKVEEPTIIEKLFAIKQLLGCSCILIKKLCKPLLANIK